MKLRLTVAYDGAAFAGWQSQKGGGTVQDALEHALERITGAPAPVTGAGRTDAGVHAIGQCAHVVVPDSGMSPDVWKRALNGNLPDTIRVLGVRKAPAAFHARFSAKAKVYRYTVWNADVIPPLELGRAWHVPGRLDHARLRAACDLFTGTHDFAAFSANRSPAPHSTERVITGIAVRRSGPRVTLTFTGGGFLYKMVRMLTAAVIRCAQDRVGCAELENRLRDGAPRWNHVAPAGGLVLVRVIY